MNQPISISKEVIKTQFNPNKYPLIYNYKAEINFSDLNIFTKGPPYEHFEKMRKLAPIYFHPAFLADVEPGFWSLTRYKDIIKVSSDPKTFSSQIGTGTLMTLGSEERRHPKLWPSSIDHMLNLDGDLHINLRREHMPFFKPDYIADLRTKVQTKVTSLLDAMETKKEFNFVHEFSQQLPIFTLSEILGIPDEDRPKLVTWMEFLELAQYMQIEQLKLRANKTPNTDMINMFNNMVDEMFEYGRDILNSKRKNPANDLLSAIANAELEGQKLSPEFLDGSWLLIIFAGNDTTRNTLSGAIKLLTENPDQKEKLLKNKDLMPNFLQECIRMVSPVMHMRRTSTCETQIGEQRIGKGEKIVMWYGAANRDPSVFMNPNQFDIERENADKHLAFGIGRHTCIGKPVALMQLEEAYKQILSRFPDIHMNGKWKVAPNNFVHAIQEMPVKI
ncbi:MAG: cytochrome P450 [Pseudomonadota bacterium]|nr:cytochrome P450 [Pseudomonadota bacterium]